MDQNLFNTNRLRPSTSDTTDAIQLFESDRGRVLFSAPFRRLQSKAQVFSLESNASVRSRLTHTMEVAHIGRYISQQLSKIANDNNDQELAKQCKFIAPLVETACLLHDIGNPPFGHLGEDAIKNWFKEKAPESHKKSTQSDININNPYYKDLESFDGNPQGARIVLTLQGFPNKNGFNLTAAQVASIIKYPQFSNEIRVSSRYKKFATFTSEKEKIEQIWSNLNLEWGVRHPCVYLMEASDDIAYCLSDIEDGIEKKIIKESDVIEYLTKKFTVYSDDLKECIPQTESEIVSRFVFFRTSMINLLTKVAADKFYNNKDNLHELKSIFDDKQENVDDYTKALEDIKSFCKENIYKSKEAEDIEIAGYNIVYGLLDKFSILLNLPKEDFLNIVNNRKGSPLAVRMFGKLPENFLNHYKYSAKSHPDQEWFIRAQLIVDYISGMTDEYSLQLHKLLNGIEIDVV